MKIPYGRQNIDQSDIDGVVSTLKSDFLTQGPKIKEFEEKFANYVGSKYALSVTNATSALHLSVLALGLKKVIESLPAQYHSQLRQIVLDLWAQKFGLQI